MAKAIGIDIVGNRLFAAEVQGSARSPRVTAVLQAELPESLSRQRADALGKWLRPLLGAAGFSAKEAVCLLDRSRVVPRNLSLPRCPEGELPALVAFEVQEDVKTAGATIIDFQADLRGKEEIDVFATVVSEAEIAALRAVFDSAGLACDHIGFRPYGSAVVIDRSSGHDNATRLNIVVGPEILELSIWNGPQLFLSRSVPLSPDSNARERVVAEARRTLAALDTQASGPVVEQVVLCGEPDLAEPLHQALRQPVTSVSLAELVDYSSAEPIERYVAATGAALQRLGARESEINWLDPRKPATADSGQKRVAVLASLFAVLVLVGGYLYIDNRKALRQQRIDALKSSLQDAEIEIAALDPFVKRQQSVKKWIDSDVHWLNELHDFAATFPDTTKAYVTSLTLAPGREEIPGEIQLAGRAHDASIVTEAQRSWQFDEYYDVTPGAIDLTDDPSDFDAGFRLVLDILPLTPEQYLKRSRQVDAVRSSADVPSDMRRIPVAIGTGKAQRPAPETKVASKEGSPPSLLPPPPSAPTTAGADDGDPVSRLVAKIKALPTDQREAEIAKAPRVIQSRLRKMLAEGSP